MDRTIMDSCKFGNTWEQKIGTLKVIGPLFQHYISDVLHFTVTLTETKHRNKQNQTHDRCHAHAEVWFDIGSAAAHFLSHRFPLLGHDFSAAQNSFHSCDKPVN